MADKKSNASQKAHKPTKQTQKQQKTKAVPTRQPKQALITATGFVPLHEHRHRDAKNLSQAKLIWSEMDVVNKTNADVFNNELGIQYAKRLLDVGYFVAFLSKTNRALLHKFVLPSDVFKFFGVSYTSQRFMALLQDSNGVVDDYIITLADDYEWFVSRMAKLGNPLPKVIEKERVNFEAKLRQSINRTDKDLKRTKRETTKHIKPTKEVARYQVLPNGEAKLVKLYPSVSVAAKDLGIATSTMNRIVLSERRTKDGMILRYTGNKRYHTPVE